jgi:vancomycin resistance protein YoaR
MTTVAPQVADKEAQRVLSELAEPAVALPVALAVGEETAGIPPADIARTLTFAPKATTLEATLDGEKLHKRLRDELAGIEQPGRDASIRIKGGKPVVVPSRTGRAVDSAELTKEAEALNITEKLSSFRQAFPPAAYRYTNVGEAARRLNGTIIEPGETFSMNDTVKERTRANGYTEGFIISGGRFREELGGGVSIITTATWTAGFFAGLERVEQHPHGLYISRYQAGLEATVAWGLLDLKMRNETGNGVLITATRYTDGVLIEMWGTKKWEDVTATFTQRRNYTDFQTIYDDGEKCVPSEGVRGFSIAVTRRRINDGKSTSTETWPTTYKPTPNVICGPKP